MPKKPSKLQELRDRSPFKRTTERKGRGRRQINANFVRTGRSFKSHEAGYKALLEGTPEPEQSGRMPELPAKAGLPSVKRAESRERLARLNERAVTQG